MKMVSSIENREKLQQVLMNSLKAETQTLGPELQSILVDDLVTAFYNRLKVMKRIQQKQ